MNIYSFVPVNVREIKLIAPCKDILRGDIGIFSINSDYCSKEILCGYWYTAVNNTAAPPDCFAEELFDMLNCFFRTNGIETVDNIKIAFERNGAYESSPDSHIYILKTETPKFAYYHELSYGEVYVHCFDKKLLTAYKDEHITGISSRDDLINIAGKLKEKGYTAEILSNNRKVVQYVIFYKSTNRIYGVESSDTNQFDDVIRDLPDKYFHIGRFGKYEGKYDIRHFTLEIISAEELADNIEEIIGNCPDDREYDSGIEYQKWKSEKDLCIERI